MIRFLDLAAINRSVEPDLRAALERVLSSGWFVLGPEVESFEAEWAAFVGARHCVSVGNGLDALTLALRATGVGAGDEVVVPAHTFVATWLAVAAVGAQPRPVEVDAHSFNLSAEAVEAALNPRVKAILPVHLYGRPADGGALRSLATDRGIALIEDAAQAHGARVGNRWVGGTGSTACWSFYPGKNLGALGDAGAVTTDDDGLAQALRLLRNYGSERKYVHEQAGVNSRCDEIQAAVLRAKLPYLHDWNARRRIIAQTYSNALAGAVRVPGAEDGLDSAWHLYVIRCADRDGLAWRLAERGVETLIHYPTPPHRQAAFKGQFDDAEFPLAGRLAGEVLSLPIGPHLDDAQVQQVIDAVLACA